MVGSCNPLANRHFSLKVLVSFDVVDSLNCRIGIQVCTLSHLSYWTNTPWLEGILVSTACLWSREAQFTLQKLGSCIISYIRQYICYPRLHLFQHSMETMNLKDHFTILTKCRSNLDCLPDTSKSYIRNLRPVVSTQSEQNCLLKNTISLQSHVLSL